jgi:DNA-binding NarL/FixJ family response regulator
MKAHSLTHPRHVTHEVQQHCYHLILLDIVMSEISGLDLLVDLRKLSPATKVIILTGYADKDVAIQALRRGAFDLLEKPVAMDLLSHAVQRALTTQHIEAEHQRTLAQLEQNQKALATRTAQLEQSNRDLLETNKALTVLARNVERTRHETEKRIREQIRHVLLPLLEKYMETLRQDNNLTRYEPQLTMVRSYLEDMMSGLATGLYATAGLSFMELRIALMIKNGLSSEEITTRLYISPETVKTHRRNIRRKLGLVGTKHGLRLYLQSFERDALTRDSLEVLYPPSTSDSQFEH